MRVGCGEGVDSGVGSDVGSGVAVRVGCVEGVGASMVDRGAGVSVVV